VQGFTNPGLLCYANSVCQALRFAAPIEMAPLSDRELTFLNMMFADDRIPLETRLDSTDIFIRSRQHDAAEFLDYVFNLMEPLARTFSSLSNIHLVCHCGEVRPGFQNSGVDSMFKLNFPPNLTNSDKYSLADLIDYMLLPTIIEVDCGRGNCTSAAMTRFQTLAWTGQVQISTLKFLIFRQLFFSL
jgi:hypothetical protein